MITVGELKKFLADKPDDMDFDFLVTAIEWVVKSPGIPATVENTIANEASTEDGPEEKAVADEVAD